MESNLLKLITHGIILAGGQSQRFKSNKALHLVKNQTLLERTISLVQALNLQPVIVASSNQDYHFTGQLILTDSVSNQGPLRGLQTAFNAFANSTLLVLSCDMPNLNIEVLQHLIQHSKQNAATLYRLNSNYKQPFPAIYDSTLIKKVEQQLSKKKFSMQEFLSDISLKEIENPFSPSIFLNLNHQSDISQIV